MVASLSVLLWLATLLTVFFITTGLLDWAVEKGSASAPMRDPSNLSGDGLWSVFVNLGGIVVGSGSIRQ